MNDLALVGHQVRYEQKMYWRNPGSAFFTFAFPIIFFFIFASIFGHRSDDSTLHGVKLIQYYTPSILGYAVMSACFLNIAMALVNRRDVGILKRLRGTPLPAWALMAGVVGSSMIVSVLLTGVSLGFAAAVYGVSLPAGHVLPLLVTIVVAALAFCALGVLASAFIPNADAAPAIVNLPYFVLVFISGTYFPVSGTLAKVADIFPLRPFIQAMYAAFDPTVHGSAWAPHELAVVAAWGAGAALMATRRFRWDPRRT